MIAYMENEGQQSLPSVGSLDSEWENSDNVNVVLKEKSFQSKEDMTGEKFSDPSASSTQKRKITAQQRITPSKTNGESSRKQNESSSSPESRQIGEGRQGAIVDVRSIIADHRLKHPETVPRR